MHITANIIANVLGLGELSSFAVRVKGDGCPGKIRRGTEKSKREKGRPRGASGLGRPVMKCGDFLILNISSLQLIPVNITRTAAKVRKRRSHGGHRPGHCGHDHQHGDRDRIL